MDYKANRPISDTSLPELGSPPHSEAHWVTDQLASDHSAPDGASSNTPPQHAGSTPPTRGPHTQDVHRRSRAANYIGFDTEGRHLDDFRSNLPDQQVTTQDYLAQHRAPAPATVTAVDDPLRASQAPATVNMHWPTAPQGEAAPDRYHTSQPGRTGTVCDDDIDCPPQYQEEGEPSLSTGANMGAAPWQHQGIGDTTPGMPAPADPLGPPDYAKWPFPAGHLTQPTARLYDQALSAKLSGKPPPSLHQHTNLKLEAWKEACTGHYMDEMVCEGIEYGFPIQYQGPPRYGPPATYNHSSALAFSEHVDDYVSKEVAHGALEGPFSSPPFTPWFYTSPLMTREKGEGDTRRIIVDLSFPHGGINHYIPRHAFQGRQAVHNLPTIDSAVNTLTRMCPGSIHLAVIDLSRAYRQFPVSPLDWPLLGISWKGSWTFDRRLPFGSRMSSFVMQMVADFLVRALSTQGITCHMYLDDVLVISPTAAKAERDFDSTIQLLNSLGLEVAPNKLQPPATAVTWLGIRIDLPANQLSIPEKKLGQIKLCMATAASRNVIPRKLLQRLIGLANHLAKVVRAARTFICRLLAALRAATGDYIKITRQVKADLAWFARYVNKCNGKAIIPNNRVVKRIWADACLTGAGASDGEAYYEHIFSASVTADHHITLLEAMNCVAAVRRFVTIDQAGGTIEVFCDNRPAVDAFTSGRARNAILAGCARALWYHAAMTDTDVVFTHVPGEGMALPDALSRASSDPGMRVAADRFVGSMNLTRVQVSPTHFTYDLLS